MPLLAIDASHSRDLDDAIAVERRGDGWAVTVAVAAVATAVPQGGDVDRAAFGAAFTRYAADRVRASMLPARLVEERLSLSPDGPREAVVAEFRVGPDLSVGEPALAVRPVTVGRLSHEAARAAIDDPGHPLHGELAPAWELARLLLAHRRRRGALAFCDVRRGLCTDEDGRLVPLANPAAHKAHILIQEAMVLANTALSAYFAVRGVPMLYRNHRGSPVASREALLQDMDTAAQSGGDYGFVQQRMALLLGRARHGAMVEGHYGLNLPVYGWFTSPIRRYADLVNQRILLASARGAEAPYSAGELAEIAAAINAAEDEAKRSTEEHLRGAAQQRAARQIASGTAAKATAQEFERVVKAVFVTGDLPDDVAAAAVKRVRSGRLQPKEMARLLLAEHGGPGFDAVRSAVRERLAAEPPLASQILNYAAQAMGLVDGGDTGGSAFPFPTVAAAQFRGEQFCSPVCRAGSKKDARQRAQVSLLMRIAGLGDVAWEQPPGAPAQPAAPAASPPPGDPGTGDAKCDLNQYCQKRRLAPPAYATVQSGPPHQPTFASVARVAVDGAVVESQRVSAATKKEAEKLAAGDLLRRLAQEQDGRSLPGAAA